MVHPHSYRTRNSKSPRVSGHTTQSYCLSHAFNQQRPFSSQHVRFRLSSQQACFSRGNSWVPSNSILPRHLLSEAILNATGQGLHPQNCPPQDADWNPHIVLLLLFYFVLEILRITFRALCMLGKHPNTNQQPQIPRWFLSLLLLFLLLFVLFLSEDFAILPTVFGLVLLLPQPPVCWSCRRVLPHLAFPYVLNQRLKTDYHVPTSAAHLSNKC